MTKQRLLYPTSLQALLLVAVILLCILYNVAYLGQAPHRAFLLCIAIIVLFAIFHRVSLRALLVSLRPVLRTIVSAVSLFALIGLLISSWLAGGTIPTILYYSLQLIDGPGFFATAFIVTAITGTMLGSSLTTIATVGVALMAMAESFGLSAAITAGAIVSGAFFGDKMSPLSDTTNLAASVVRIDLFTHIRNMLWTTVPAFLLSVLLFYILSPSMQHVDASFSEQMRTTLLGANLVHGYALIPMLVLLLGSLAKQKASIVLLLSTLAAIICGLFHRQLGPFEWLSTLYEGFTFMTNVEAVDSLLNRGGVASMFFTMSLVALALLMGQLLFVCGIIDACLRPFERLLRTAAEAITGAATMAIGINLLIGEQYLSLLLTGETFKHTFAKLQLHPKNLARVMEDAGTVVNPLVPWSVCGLFITTVLQIDVLAYVPFAFFCLFSPVLTLLFGYFGWTITKTKQL